MRGSLWAVVVAAVGAAVLLRGAGQATPASPANSTQAAETVLSTTAPVLGQLLLLAGIGAVILLAVRAT
jgi:hypothetical protein